jgi:hypothetical protein
MPYLMQICKAMFSLTHRRRGVFKTEFNYLWAIFVPFNREIAAVRPDYDAGQGKPGF